MNDLELWIGQMVAEISRQARELDPVRLGWFLDWLCAHTAQVNAGLLEQGALLERLQPALRAWFMSLSMQGMLWEYRLLLDEIAWWRELDDLRLRLLADQRGRWE